MQPLNYIISIPEPCHKDWNSMTPDANGKFCNSCSKSVIDFTNKTDTEIHAMMMDRKDEKVCGHFKKTQVNRPLSLTIPFHTLPRNLSPARAFAVALFIVFGTLLFSCTNEHNQKINEINKQINQPDNGAITNRYPNLAATNNDSNEQFSNEVDRLQDMMQQMNGSPEADPEMQQLNGTLEKILDIQHPDRVKEKLKEKSLKSKEQVFIVTRQFVKNNISLLDTGKSKRNTENKFFGVEEDVDSEEQNTVEAVVHQTQTLVNGSVVKMRLLNDIYLNGSLVKKCNFVFGIAELNDERLEININSIRNNNSLFPVKLEVFDMDGLAGIYIPGAISRDVAKQSTDNSLQLLELTSMDPSFKAQAAATGINAAKSLLSKKVKQVKVLVKAGYKVLLRDKSIQQ